MLSEGVSFVALERERVALTTGKRKVSAVKKMTTGIVHDQNLEKHIEKQMGCMAGFLQIFDRNQILAGKRLYSTKRLPSSTMVSAQLLFSICLDLRFIAQPMFVCFAFLRIGFVHTRRRLIPYRNRRVLPLGLRQYLKNWKSNRGRDRRHHPTDRSNLLL